MNGPEPVDAVRAALKWALAEMAGDMTEEQLRECTAGQDFIDNVLKGRQALAALDERGSVAVPDGWKLVPREPSEEMFAATHGWGWGRSDVEFMFRMMWDAATPREPISPSYEKCPSCNGSGLALNSAGEPDNCHECKGNTVIASGGAVSREEMPPHKLHEAVWGIAFDLVKPESVDEYSAVRDATEKVLALLTPRAVGEE